MSKLKKWTSTSTENCPTVSTLVDLSNRVITLDDKSKAYVTNPFKYKNEELYNAYVKKTEASPYLRPTHYGGPDNSYEVFNVLEAWGLDKDFYLGNVIKYIARAGKKDATKELEDLEKAEVYLKRRIAELKK